MRAPLLIYASTESERGVPGPFRESHSSVSVSFRYAWATRRKYNSLKNISNWSIKAKHDKNIFFNLIILCASLGNQKITPIVLLPISSASKRQVVVTPYFRSQRFFKMITLYMKNKRANVKWRHCAVKNTLVH